MWGPFVSLRRRWRPLPTVGWVFLLRWDYGPQVHLMRSRWHIPVPGRTGKERDLCIPIADPEAALAEARSLIDGSLKPGAEIVAMREADRRDIPEDWCGPRIGPWRHFGFRPPRGGEWSNSR